MPRKGHRRRAVVGLSWLLYTAWRPRRSNPSSSAAGDWVSDGSSGASRPDGSVSRRGSRTWYACRWRSRLSDWSLAGASRARGVTEDGRAGTGVGIARQFHRCPEPGKPRLRLASRGALRPGRARRRLRGCRTGGPVADRRGADADGRASRDCRPSGDLHRAGSGGADVGAKPDAGTQPDSRASLGADEHAGRPSIPRQPRRQEPPRRLQPRSRG